MRYPGGKGRSYQHIINLLPEHSTYIETHLGGGAVLRNKRPALESIAIDRDPKVIAKGQDLYPNLARYIVADATEFLSSYSFCGSEVVYCDPPYVSSTRRNSRIYRFEYTDADHRQLLEVITKLPCRVLISGYYSQIYAEALSGWNSFSFSSKTHNGMRQEIIWFNYERPVHLHDFRYLGCSFRERQTVKRRLQRITNRLRRLSAQEQHFVATWLGNELDGANR